MSKENTYYITTTLPYVNSDPHVGHAMEFVRADASARYHKMLGQNVFLNTGTDEHGSKIFEKATEAGKTPQEYADHYAEIFKGLVKKLGMLPETNFVRTTDDAHKAAAQAFWKVCDAKGDIYKKNYQVKYCIGCELEKTDSDLVDGKCPDHPGRELELRDEENYFFRFSNYEKPLLDLYENNPEFVLPDFRFNEIKAFVKRGLNDFSISRPVEKMSWGVPVPGDESHVMYVWFDALVNYIDAIGWPQDMERFNTYWPVIQYAGKDNLRQQTAMWQAMLLSAGLPTSKQIIINGHIMGEGGVKMSKSIGNVIDPLDVVSEYGTDGFRYMVLRELSAFEDSEFSAEKIKEAYNANLANGIGNLLSRTMKMATSYGVSVGKEGLAFDISNPEFDSFRDAAEAYNHQKSMDIIWERVKTLDTFIADNEPFKKIKVDEEGAKLDVAFLLHGLYKVGNMLKPYMPETAEKIIEAVEKAEMPEPLFRRKD